MDVYFDELLVKKRKKLPALLAVLECYLTFNLGSVSWLKLNQKEFETWAENLIQFRHSKIFICLVPFPPLKYQHFLHLDHLIGRIDEE